jgi:hypothetical protein
MGKKLSDPFLLATKHGAHRPASAEHPMKRARRKESEVQEGSFRDPKLHEKLGHKAR